MSKAHQEESAKGDQVVAEVKKTIADAVAAMGSGANSPNAAAIISAIDLKRKETSDELKSDNTYPGTYSAARAYVCQFEFRLWNPSMPAELKQLAIDDGTIKLLREMTQELDGATDVSIFLKADKPQSKFNALATYLQIQDCPELGIVTNNQYHTNGLTFYDSLIDLLTKEKAGTLSDTEQSFTDYKSVAVLALQTFHNLNAGVALRTAAKLSGVIKPGEFLPSVITLALLNLDWNWLNSWDLDLSHGNQKQLETIDSSMKIALATEHQLHDTLAVEPLLESKLRHFIAGTKSTHPQEPAEAQLKANCDLILKMTH